MDVQKQIRENTLELHEFLKDLKGWENTVKEKERNLKSQAVTTANNVIPTPRKNPGTTLEEKDTEVRETATNKSNVKKSFGFGSGTKLKEKSPPSAAGVTAASHTYDYFRDKWDKFDVDAALKEIEDDDGTSRENASAKGAPPVRGSQLKRNKTEERSSTTEATAKAQPMEPGKLFGRGVGPRGAVDRLSGPLGYDEPPDATSEKELGNEYFKEGKYVRAIDCYSRSIALQPTAVAYANRAMAALKIRRYEDAELDCSEAISLDDRYTKAYARRGTARKELKKFLLAIEDFEFALRLEPENKELRRQYMEAREFYEKSSGQKPSEKPVPVIVRELAKEVKASPQAPVPGKSKVTAVEDTQKPVLQPIVSNPTNSSPIEIGGEMQTGAKTKTKNAITTANSISSSRPLTASVQSKAKITEKGKMNEKKVTDIAAIQNAAAKAAATAAMAAVRNFSAPKTAYEFETLWKGFDGNREAQSRLLKVMDPLSLPRVFKDSLSAALMVDIIRCLDLLFPADANFAVRVLENLTKVGRFSMTVMFLSAKERTDLGKLWDEVFMKSSPDLHDTLRTLRATYRL